MKAYLKRVIWKLPTMLPHFFFKSCSMLKRLAREINKQSLNWRAFFFSFFFFQGNLIVKALIMGQEKERREKWWCVYFIFSHFPSFSGKDENGWNHYGTTLEKMVARTCSTKQMSNQKQRNLEEKINKELQGWDFQRANGVRIQMMMMMMMMKWNGMGQWGKALSCSLNHSQPNQVKERK